MVTIVGGDFVDTRAQIKAMSMGLDNPESMTIEKRRYNATLLTQRHKG